ncbi:MAG: ChbG/HpnK family deacetylase [Elusimicrobia bacterium]|nr:ChbG/HpnK family deacetylase [Elusimicrobiota bacterium]
MTPSPAPSLIVSADDFGSTPGVNEAVSLAHRHGVLTHASLMVRGAAASEAVRIAGENPGLGVGVHLELCSDAPAAWGLKSFLSGGRGLAEEIEEQVRLCLSFGIKPTHLDSHLNAHVHPTVFPLVVAAALRHGIPRVRLTGGEAGLRARFGGPGTAPALALGCVFAALRLRLKGLLPADGRVTSPDRTLGLLRSGMMTEDYLLWLIPRLPAGVTELYLHPTTDPTARSESGPTPTHHSHAEYLALRSPAVRESLSRSGVKLAGSVRPAGAGPG